MYISTLKFLNIFKERWKILYHPTLQFITDCNSKRIIEIGLSLPKLSRKYNLHLFMANGVYTFLDIPELI